MRQIVYRKLTEIKKLPNNPRTIKKADMEKLKKSLQDNKDYFEARPIILSNRTGELVILAGNQRYEAAKAIGMQEVPTILLEGLTEEREKEIIIRDNVSNGEWDWDELANAWDVDLLDDWGVDVPDWAATEQEIEEDEAPEVDESEPAKSELGKVYKLGNHRLMCGDSTDAGSVAILMDGQKADMVFTDPPYGMHLDPDWSSAHGAFGHGLKHDKVIGDNEDFTSDLIKTVFDNFGYCKEIFLWGCDYYAELIENRNLGSIIVWDKSIDEQADKMFGSNFELCWSKNRHKRELARVKWKGIFGVADDQKNRVHPTQKPAALAVWFLQKYSKDNNLVVDLYGGSGSTLVACEQLGRKCYMMELDPKYCDVIRKRYWKLTHDGDEDGWEEGTKAV